MATLKEIFKAPSFKAPQLAISPTSITAHSTPLFTGAGYSPTVASPESFVQPTAGASTPGMPQSVPQISGGSAIPPQFLDPKTGGLLAPSAVADNIANTLPQRTYDVPKTAGDMLANPDMGVGELNTRSRELNNARNDIAVGATDPYGTFKTNIAFSPEQRKAIERAYAGIYDPALQEVFTKLQAKEQEDKQRFELQKLAQQHQYAMEEKYGKGGTGVTTDGGYTKGQDTNVDMWVERINRTGEDLNKAIPGVANQSLRNKVAAGLEATKYDSAQANGILDDVNNINNLLNNPELSQISGLTDQFLGGYVGDAKTAKTVYNQIIGTIQLAKAGKIKGQGAVSDYERTTLKEAAAAIDRGQSDEDFRDALIQIRGALKTSAGMEAAVRITDPNTGQSDDQMLNSKEIQSYYRDGAIIKYLE